MALLYLFDCKLCYPDCTHKICSPYICDKHGDCRNCCHFNDPDFTLCDFCILCIHSIDKWE